MEEQVQEGQLISKAVRGFWVDVGWLWQRPLPKKSWALEQIFSLRINSQVEDTDLSRASGESVLKAKVFSRRLFLVNFSFQPELQFKALKKKERKHAPFLKRYRP
ncbi:hypothetical protein FJZ31_27975 [Candidatus Poribacteria bacterium]|nr:hypothetical protein [Candidatus Poribacteria bacterium]